MRLFPRRHRRNPLATREASPSSSLLPVAGALHEATAYESCERHRTKASTLKWRESCGITKYVRLATFRKEQNANSNSAVDQTQSLKTWGEELNGPKPKEAEKCSYHRSYQRTEPLTNKKRVTGGAGQRRSSNPGPDGSPAVADDLQGTRSAHPRAADCGPGQSAPPVVADEALFAPYQPIYRPPYDLTNPFDRTNIGIVIRSHAERCEDYLALIGRLRRTGVMGADDFLQRANETILSLRKHRQALARLYDISGGNR